MHLLVIGDSIAYGACAMPRSGRWCDVLVRQLEAFVRGGITLTNLAVPGDTLAQARMRLPDALALVSRDVDLLMAAYGLNDLRAGSSVEQTLNDFALLLEQLRAGLSVRAIVVPTVFPIHSSAYARYAPYDSATPALRDAYNRALPGWAVEQNVILMNIEPPEGTEEGLLDFDGIHPNNLGHRFMANVMLNALLTAPTLASLWLGERNVSPASGGGGTGNEHTMNGEEQRR